MRKLHLLIVSLVAFSYSGVCAAQQTPISRTVSGDFSVMTWNLEWFFDNETNDNFSDLSKEMSAPGRTQWDWRRDAVAASIVRVRPTVVAFQEIENQRVLWYLTRALDRNHNISYRESFIEGTDRFTEQDVGFLTVSTTDMIQMSRLNQTRAMKASKRYYNLSKHLLGVFEVAVAGKTERVYILNLHLRAKAEAAEVRMRQCRLAHRWVADLVEAGQHVIVIGDMNTEEKAGAIHVGSDMHILCGKESASPADDLVDLHQFVPQTSRGTHLLPGRQFDRILATPSLVDDKPGVKDLSLKSVAVLHELNHRAGRDTQADHWDDYWGIPDASRDISDHCPVLATFTVK